MPLGTTIPTTGSVLRLPFEDQSFDTVVSTDCLEHLAEDDLPLAIREIARVARRQVYLRIATRPDRDKKWHLTVKPRKWWEDLLLGHGHDPAKDLPTISWA